MSATLRLLDLFCCAGGAGMGYHRAGFEVVAQAIPPAYTEFLGYQLIERVKEAA